MVLIRSGKMHVKGLLYQNVIHLDAIVKRYKRRKPLCGNELVTKLFKKILSKAILQKGWQRMIFEKMRQQGIVGRSLGRVGGSPSIRRCAH